MNRPSSTQSTSSRSFPSACCCSNHSWMRGLVSAAFASSRRTKSSSWRIRLSVSIRTASHSGLSAASARNAASRPPLEEDVAEARVHLDRELDEQVVLVLEVVEDRAAREAGRLLELDAPSRPRSRARRTRGVRRRGSRRGGRRDAPGSPSAWANPSHLTKPYVRFILSRVLKNRSLIGLLTAELVSLTGSAMTFVALPWFVLATTGSTAKMGWVLAAEMLPIAIFGIPAGTVIAKLGAKKTMLISDAARGPLMLVIPILHSTGHLSFAALLGTTFAIGIFAAPYFASSRLVVPEVAGEDEQAVASVNAVLVGREPADAARGARARRPPDRRHEPGDRARRRRLHVPLLLPRDRDRRPRGQARRGGRTAEGRALRRQVPARRLACSARS